MSSGLARFQPLRVRQGARLSTPRSCWAYLRRPLYPGLGGAFPGDGTIVALDGGSLMKTVLAEPVINRSSLNLDVAEEPPPAQGKTAARLGVVSATLFLASLRWA